MNLYEAVYARKSVRKYKMERLSDRLMDQIAAFVGGAVPLDKEIKFQIEIRENLGEHLRRKGLWKVESPYYLVFFSEEKDGYERNAGYILEQIVLYLVSRGLGTCFLGGSRAVIMPPEGMRQVIMVGFGHAQDSLYRDPAVAKRLPLKELCVFREEPDETMKNILKAARLAPSSRNSQPWRFIVCRNRIHIFACREFLPSARLSSMREIDIGIVLAHIMTAAEEMWLAVKLGTDDGISRKALKNGSYIISVMLSPQ